MELKELLQKTIKTYFVLVVCISAAMYIMGSIFDPDGRYGYEMLLSPFRYAFWGALPTIVMYSKKELTMKQTIIRKVIQLILIEGEIMIVAFTSRNIDTDRISVVISLMASVLVIFIIANVVVFVNGSFSAKRLTQDLIRFQNDEK